MDYNEIYLKFFIAVASLIALYFLVGKDDPKNGGNGGGKS